MGIQTCLLARATMVQRRGRTTTSHGPIRWMTQRGTTRPPRPRLQCFPPTYPLRQLLHNFRSALERAPEARPSVRFCTERSEAAAASSAKHPLLQLLNNGSTFIEGVR